MDLNNRRTGKDATKPRALGLLGHSDSSSRQYEGQLIKAKVISYPKLKQGINSV